MHQKSLFPLPALEAFSSLPERLSPILPTIWQAVAEPMEDWRRYRESDPNFQHLSSPGAAQWLHYQIVHRAQLLFAGNSDIKTFEQKGIFVVNYRDATYLAFKKLGRDMRRKNAWTKHNHQWWTQTINTNNRHPLKVVVGYRLSRDLLNFKMYLTLPHGERVADWWNIPDQTSALIKIVSPDVLRLAKPERKGFHVKPKKDSSQKERGQDASG